ncbi:hypothetical protein [Roseomonas sp. CECT 9278]|uniref:hypothetical protein n=1 Tax=Roseomonas sp. CECT 9278 TaxID=2845823 RepID=UPI001E64EE8E|nr:hypothetical protein [Roseomonas sp. CECT 9278]CAH0288847.1 hypothetical protein ROS9278_04168 [Roseomonas sp. CECT 9278]
MALPRLAPRLAISLPLSGLFLAAQAGGQQDAAAILAMAAIGAMAAPASRALPIGTVALGTGGATALWIGQPGAAALLLAALPLAGNLLLAWHFGATLRPGREPLIARYTRAEHGRLSPELLAYTRCLTWAWTWFFLGFAALNLLTLAGAGPAPGASAAGNLALSAAFFLVEHPIRRALFPALRSASPWNTLRAIWRADALHDAR